MNYNKAHKCVQQHLLRELNEEYPVISIKGRIRNNQEEPFKFIVQVWISNLLFWGNGKKKIQPGSVNGLERNLKRESRGKQVHVFD